MQVCCNYIKILLQNACHYDGGFDGLHFTHLWSYVKQSGLVQTFLAMPVFRDIQQVLYSQCYVYNLDDGGYVEEM